MKKNCGIIVAAVLMMAGCASVPTGRDDRELSAAARWTSRPPVNQNLSVSEERFLQQLVESLEVDFLWMDMSAKETMGALSREWSSRGFGVRTLSGESVNEGGVGFQWTNLLRRGIRIQGRTTEVGTLAFGIYERASGMELERLIVESDAAPDQIADQLYRVLWNLGASGFPYEVVFLPGVSSSVISGLRSKLKVYVYRTDRVDGSRFWVWDIGSVRDFEMKLNQALDELGWSRNVVFVRQQENQILLDWID